MKTIKDWAQTAIDVQNACNLSGVVISFSNFLTWLREEYPTKGTGWYNHHPICILFSDKISSITGTDFGYGYSWCNNVCEGKAAGAGTEYET